MTPRSKTSAGESRMKAPTDGLEMRRVEEPEAPAKRSRAKAGAAGEAALGPRKHSPTGLDKMRLTGDRLMVHMPEDRERRSKGGLLIPATAAATHKRCIWSDVVMVGPETRGVRTGDLVLFIPQSGIEVEVDAETFLLLRERDVQAIASERVDPHAGQYL
jgi:chaperonin GroES